MNSMFFFRNDFTIFFIKANNVNYSIQQMFTLGFVVEKKLTPADFLFCFVYFLVFKFSNHSGQVLAACIGLKTFSRNPIFVLSVLYKFAAFTDSHIILFRSNCLEHVIRKTHSVIHAMKRFYTFAIYITTRKKI